MFNFNSMNTIFYNFFQFSSSLLLWLLARMVLELAVVLCPMEVVDFFQGVPNELWFQVVRITYYPSMFSLYLLS